MNQNIKIRVACPKDASRLLEIYKPYILNTAITFEYDVPSVEEFAKRVTNTLKKYPYLVAQVEDVIVGYAYVSAFRTRVAYNWDVETSIYVDENYHGIGVGKKLYAAIEKILSEMNIKNMYAAITNSEIEDKHFKHGSLEFHKKLGFTFVGEFRNCGYKFDKWYNLVWMEKRISNRVKNICENIDDGSVAGNAVFDKTSEKPEAVKLFSEIGKSDEEF